MKVNRGYNLNTTTGNRTIIYCEGKSNGVDIIFYKTILGINTNKYEFKALGSSNILLSYAKTELIDKGFCLIDRDFRNIEEVNKLENKYAIRFLKVHEIENILLNIDYLNKLGYIKNNVNIETEIENIIKEKRVRFLADFLQFKINNHIGRFPRISKLKNNELPKENKLVEALFSKLDNNYDEVKKKLEEIKNTYIDIWINDFNNLTIDLLPGKEIFKELKNKIFNNPPKDSDIVKDIALLMNKDNFTPEELVSILN